MADTEVASTRTRDAAAVADDPDAGTRIDRYVISRRLGAGGMGVVFLARDTELDRDVALKLVRPRSGTVAGLEARLRREAQAMAKLSHVNVVPVFDMGAVDDRLFIAMGLCEGGTLRAWMKTPRPWRSASPAG
jgi:serine/threonine protein kinase